MCGADADDDEEIPRSTVCVAYDDADEEDVVNCSLAVPSLSDIGRDDEVEAIDCSLNMSILDGMSATCTSGRRTICGGAIGI